MTSRMEDESGSKLEMSSEQMMESALRAAELVVERIQNLHKEPAWRGGSRSQLEAIMSEDPPEEGRSSLEVIERAAHEILPIAGRVDHPRFFAFVPSAPTWPGVLADFMAAGHNVFQGTWLGASGPSMLEVVVIDWFRNWIGYPDTAGGLFTSGGSAASLDGFVAAREAAGAPEHPAVYMSDQRHPALIRAARIVGVRSESIRVVPTDDHFRLDLDKLHKMIRQDQESGLMPIAICGNAGATNTGAIDPLNEIANYCESEQIWFHADAAYGGFAILAERGPELLKGLERADSIAMDAHKWLFQPFECGCLLVKDVRKLESAFSVQPEYLQDTQWGRDHPNFGDRGLQLSRSFRALKVWMSVQTFGMAAFRRAITQGIELAERAEAYIRGSRILQIANPASLGVVCFRVNPKAAGLKDEKLEEINEAVQARVIDEGIAMMSSTRLRGLYSLRLCILNHNTTWEDVRLTLGAIEDFGRDIISS